MNHEGMKQSILRGAAYGLSAWLIYGIVELGLTGVVLPFFRTDTQILAWQWSLIGMLWVVYAFFGLMLGSIGGALLAKTAMRGQQDRYTIMASLTLILAFIANLMPAWPLARSEQIALGVAAVLAAGFVVALAVDLWCKRIAFLANPWVVSLLVLGGPWISRDAFSAQSPMAKTGASFGALLAVVSAAALFGWFRSDRVPVLRARALSAATVTGTLILAALFAGRAPSAAATPPAAASILPKRPNVLLITMDTVRADHLSLYGYERETTPNLRAIAREATVYNRAIATSDFTLPTHASIFTGLYPSWHGAQYSPPGNPYGRALAPTHYLG